MNPNHGQQAPSLFDEFIELDRTFHELDAEANSRDDSDLHRLPGEAELRWPQLLGFHRVVLLSEAGSGKTEEIRNAARCLRQSGKWAFFLRIEHVVQDFENSFEEGSFEELTEWMKSAEEGWLLLDSVDEARLADPRDFERAIRKLGGLLTPALQRSHIIISGRTHAWRSKSDLMLCRSHLPYQPAEQEPDPEDSAADKSSVATTDTPKAAGQFAPFHIVSLDDLHGPQIDAFLRGKGIDDPREFRDEVERKEAWSFTTRPQDLAELLEFWKEHDRIGTRLELIQSSIKRRLQERDQNRADIQPIALEKLYKGVRLIAAAATLTQQSLIRTPDGSDNKKGLSVGDVLTDWDERDCSALLSRPIFDPGIYGTVRFHHRSVREYLTAEWLNELLSADGSRKKIEGLFFRSQYGIEIVVPTMRPILPWLVVLDQKILKRVVRLAPEILFEGGDPSQIAREVRVDILHQACELMAQPAHSQSLYDQAAVQRFANPDITTEIRDLLSTHNEHPEIAWFLLRMVWKAEIKEALPEVKAAATTSTSKQARIAAYRALSVIGSAEDRADIRTAFLRGKKDVERDLLAELIVDLPATSSGIAWLLQALERAPAKKRFSVDGLANTLLNHAGVWPVPVLPKLLDGLHRLLQKPPFIERGACAVSQRYGWLAGVAGQIVVRLIDARNPSAMSHASLSLLSMTPVLAAYSEHEFEGSKEALTKRVSQWPELNLASFWFDVATARARLAAKKEPLTDFWHAGVFGHFWRFDKSDFDAVCSDVKTRTLPDDRLVALSLAFALYRDNGRPIAWRKKLKMIAIGSPELESRLQQLLHPPAAGRQKWRAQQLSWKRQDARRQAREEESKQKWNEHLLANLDSLRRPAKPDVPTNAQYYVHRHLQEEGTPSHKWTTGGWESLVPRFGLDVARAFRDGAVNYWRGHRPQLRSEGAATNSTPFAAILGLTGLAIEAREVEDWPEALSHDEAKLATRYALHELNGFPEWITALYALHPQAIIEVLLGELDFELAGEHAEVDGHYLLYDISWGGQWLWDQLAPLLLSRLRKPLKAENNLRYVLTILHGSTVADREIAKLAAKKAKSTKNPTTAPLWFATWVGVEPVSAIPALSARLAEIKERDGQTLFAMRFITALMGGRLDSRGSRQMYRTVESMKRLYLLMHEYIRLSEDIDRTGKGVYSPELRDEAQDARNALIPFIKETPGKEAYLAMREISLAHPAESNRSWLAYQAKQKAILDGDANAWSLSQVVSFHHSLERTPSNHRDLWDLAVDQLLDLKHDLEHGDSSIASILRPVDRETLIRNYIANWCKEHANGRYTVSQEEELADTKKPDLRFHGIDFGPVPCELKLADNWSGPKLFERLQNQLCGDYLRDRHSNRGIFVLVYRGRKGGWDLPSGKRAETFDELARSLETHWEVLSPMFPEVEDIKVIGINLMVREMDSATRLDSNGTHPGP